MSPRPAYDDQREELYTVLDRDPDPAGTGLQGRSSTINLGSQPLGRPLVRLEPPVEDIAVMEVDVYPADVVGKGGAPGLRILIICPRCRNVLEFTSARKEIEFVPAERPEWDPTRQAMVDRGTLSIEPFECTWELDGKRKVAQTANGMNLCRMRLGIDRNVARRA